MSDAKTDPAHDEPPSSTAADPFEAMRTFGNLWARGSQAFVETSQKVFGDLAKAASPSGVTGVMNGLASPPKFAFAEAQKAFAASTKAAMDLSASLAKNLSGLSGEGEADAFLPKIFDPQMWVTSMPSLEGSLTQLTEGPQLADAGNTERKYAAVYAATQDLQRASLDQQTVMTQAWTRAATVYARKLGELAPSNTGPKTWREATNLWIGIANDELMQTQRSGAYLKMQRDMLKASTDLRLAQSDLATMYAEAFGLPTRAEIDDVHKTLTELRREVRALRRATAGTASRETHNG